MRTFTTYILRCHDDSFYVGVTNNIEQRLQQHEEGIDQQCYTFKHRPMKLVHVEHFDDVNDAIRREKQLKNWSRAKKEALINEQYFLLQEHAKKKRGQHQFFPVRRIGVDVIIPGDHGSMLFIQRQDDDCWSMPGGWVEENETPDMAARREVEEETGMTVELRGVIDVHVRENGSVHVTYLARQSGGVLRTQSLEAKRICFLAHDEVKKWHADHEQRIERAMKKMTEYSL